MAARIRIGISGWRYEPWRGIFYPKGLAQRRELEYASRMFPTIEMNGTFYSMQRPEYFAQWHEETPRDFLFAVKGPRYITHLRRLNEIDAPLANFFGSGLFELRAKLGPILWQFPPQMPFLAERFDAFLALLPRDTHAAAAFARRHHDHRIEGRASFDVDKTRPLRHAVEVRHPSFVDPAFVAMLRRHRISLVVADSAGRWPLIEDLTADFVYVRLHGDLELYASEYSERALDHWAGRIERWQRGSQADDVRLAAPGTSPPVRRTRDVYVYFDNDTKVHAPYDAAALSRRLGIDSPLPERDPAREPRLQAAVRRRMPGLRRRGGKVVAPPPRSKRG
jgi:uncharacterized protein YecE (DUF72 family)